MNSIVQCCLCTPLVFIPLMLHPSSTKHLLRMETKVDSCCLSSLKGNSWCLVFLFPLLSSSPLLLSWLGAGLLLAGRQHDVVWEQLLADSVPELVIKRSPETFFCRSQSRLLSRSLLSHVYHTRSKQCRKGVCLDCFHLKKKKELETFDQSWEVRVTNVVKCHIFNQRNLTHPRN